MDDQSYWIRRIAECEREAALATDAATAKIYQSSANAMKRMMRDDQLVERGAARATG